MKAMASTRCVRYGIALVTLLTAGTLGAAGLKIDLPTETAVLKQGPGFELTNTQCSICHSAEYIISQPRGKPLAFWKAEVEKMKKAYGAPIPDDDIQPVADYLTRNYGAEAAK
jgi:hypothetical protein